MIVKTYGNEVYDLAEEFMQDSPTGIPKEGKQQLTHELALRIQQAVEDWFEEKWGY